MESMIYEQQAHEQGFALVCGVDEAERVPSWGRSTPPPSSCRSSSTCPA